MSLPASFSHRARSKTLTLLLAVTACGSLLWSAGSAAETYYKWRNDQGVWTYGAHPPQGVEAIEVQTTVSSRPSQSAEESAEGEAEEEAAGEAQSETTEYIVEERIKASKAEQARLCKAAKANLETLNSSAVIRKRDADGNVVVISDDERQAEIENAQQTIKDFC